MLRGMATSVQRRANRWQLRVTHAKLPRPFFWTFDTEVEARAYAAGMKATLDAGIVPQELVAVAPGRADKLVAEIMSDYIASCPALTPSDSALITTMLPEITIRMSELNYPWVEAYVEDLKRVRHLTPGSIRKRIGSLGRVIDWHLRRSESPAANPLRLLPKGYSNYTAADADSLPEQLGSKTDVSRDRRLLPGEDEAIRELLEPDLRLLFDILVWTGLRLREAYKLRVDQIDLARKVIRVEGSKARRGQLKPRVVPMAPELRLTLAEAVKGRVGLLMSFWSGDPDEQDQVTSRLSYLFADAFKRAGCIDLTAHDLRHEACCRWLERRNASGWVLSDVEVARIMGWSSMRMMLRYASIRGEDLAARLG